MAIPAASRAKSEDAAGKRLNPIKRKQMEDRVHELEARSIVWKMPSRSAKQPCRPSSAPKKPSGSPRNWHDARAELQSRLAEWEELGQALQI